MFEARLEQGQILKKLVEALKDLVVDVNFDVSPKGITLQARGRDVRMHICKRSGMRA